MERLRLATAWFGGCAGCHMSFLDMDEFLIDLAGKVDVVYSPLIDVKTYPENVDVCLVEGAICNEDNLDLLLRVRRRTRTLVGFGDCAVTGNVPALRNTLCPESAANVLQCAYVDHADHLPRLPRAKGLVPVLLERVRPLHEFVTVDAFLPGCPPPAHRIRAVLDRILAGLPPQLTGEQIRFG